MGNHAANDLIYLISIKQSEVEQLGMIRHWEGLSLGHEADTIWVKGFTVEQIESVALKRIPFIQRYRSEYGKLFPFDSLLPLRNEPALLWTPILRALRVQLPPLNHNFFGLSDNIQLKLVPSQQEQQAMAMIVALTHLQAYLHTAPRIRLEMLQWCLIGEQQAFLLGKPLLPLPGNTYWNQGNFFLPAGLDFDLHLMAKPLDQKLNPR